jgi:hypothetical protein
MLVLNPLGNQAEMFTWSTRLDDFPALGVGSIAGLAGTGAIATLPLLVLSAFCKLESLLLDMCGFQLVRL